MPGIAWDGVSYMYLGKTEIRDISKCVKGNHSQYYIDKV